MSRLGERLIEYAKAGECTGVQLGIIQHFVNWVHAQEVAETRERNGWPWYACPGSEEP